MHLLADGVVALRHEPGPDVVHQDAQTRVRLGVVDSHRHDGVVDHGGEALIDAGLPDLELAMVHVSGHPHDPVVLVRQRLHEVALTVDHDPFERGAGLGIARADRHALGGTGGEGLEVGGDGRERERGSGRPGVHVVSLAARLAAILQTVCRAAAGGAEQGPSSRTRHPTTQERIHDHYVHHHQPRRRQGRRPRRPGRRRVRRRAHGDPHRDRRPARPVPGHGRRPADDLGRARLAARRPPNATSANG